MVKKSKKVKKARISSEKPFSKKRRKKKSHRKGESKEKEKKKGQGDIGKAIDKTHAQLKKWTETPPPRGSDEAFALDPWQKEAYELLLEGQNVVVDAPTTAGKTRVVEVYFRSQMDNPEFRAVYTTPVKSLSNDKYAEFKELFGESRVGIATGDRKENLGAQVVIATLESYRNSLLGVEPDLGRKMAVFDEYHFLQDPSRGSAWEEAIILGPPTTQILMLSASVKNPQDIAAWIAAIKKRRCQVVEVSERPVPLADMVYYKEEWLLASEVNLPTPHRRDSGYRFPLEHDELARRLGKIEALNLLPCICYVGQRLGCESMAGSLAKVIDPLSQEEAAILSEKLHKLDEKMSCLKFFNPFLRRILIQYGIAYHHSGLGPPARQAIEALLKNGDLRFCVSTMGLSLGVNFAVRSAVIADFRRPGASGFTDYPPTDVLQMLGRAGRRGQDTVGFSLWAGVHAYRKFTPARREPAYSRLRHDPATFLGLIGRGYSLKKLEQFYSHSLLKFQSKAADFRLLSAQELSKGLKEEVPCRAPAYEYMMHQNEQSKACRRCPLLKKCHRFIGRSYSNELSYLHMHLHAIGCLDEDDKLTRFGDIARYFPQSGGLVLAKKIVDGKVGATDLLSGLELMAALTTARFKKPFAPKAYSFSFKHEPIEEELMEMYPYELFEELYDPPFGYRVEPCIREFNPLAGYFVREWAMGADFHQLSRAACHSKFAVGDMMNVIYRAATYLQSMVQADIPGVSKEARGLWEVLLREPLAAH